MSPRLLIDGLMYPECPRWHDGRLWISDQHAGRVYSLTEAGEVLDSFSVSGGASGLGWLPNGDLLVVSMAERRLLRRNSDGLLEPYAELAGVHPGESNDMVVDAQGNAFVGNIGFDFNAGEAMRTTNLALVRPDGSVSVAAQNLLTPNGSVISADGATLILAESWRHCLTAFRIGPDRQLSERRTWASLEERHVPDGICLDDQGCIWLASPFAHQVIRVAEGGAVREVLEIEDGNPYACMLGGSDGRTLFVCIAPDHDPEVTKQQQRGRVEAWQAPAGRAGWPA